jgi:hypothetical protein
MYKPVDFFRHDWHSSPVGAGLTCEKCHTPGLSRSAETSKTCSECHPKYTMNNAVSKPYYADSYTDAMHKQCVSCHREQIRNVPEKHMLDECTTCHKNDITKKIDMSINWDITKPGSNNVILPLPEDDEKAKKDE